MKSLTIVLSIALFCSLTANAQSSTDSVKVKTKTEFNLYGGVGVAFDLAGEAVYVNFGGPKLGVNIKEKVKIALSFYPSVKLPTNDFKFALALGFGPEVEWDNWILSAPLYPGPDGVKPALGMGYKF